jgi:hypothetical protein
VASTPTIGDQNISTHTEGSNRRMGKKVMSFIIGVLLPGTVRLKKLREHVARMGQMRNSNKASGRKT